MLFMPTNITPSAWGEPGNGTVDITKGLEVSWQVNGNSYMTAFEISIYKNDTAGTVVYQTGKKTDGCPFAGTDAQGNIRFFSYTIPAAALTTAGMSNGNDYKLLITQYWSDNDSITQASASAFITRSTPTVTMGAIPSPVAARAYTFTASYAQEQGDALTWVRWRIANFDDVENPLQDTGNIYSTPELQFSYDGLFSSTQYSVRCQIQTENGVQADTGWVSFSVEYSAPAVSGLVSLKTDKKHSGVIVSWPQLMYIYGEASGGYTVEDGYLTLPAGSSVTWDDVTGANMEFPTPWAVVWRGKITTDGGNVLTITMGTTITPIILSVSQDGATVTQAGQATYSFSTAFELNDIVTVIIQDGAFYLRRERLTQGLFPSSKLHPGTATLPSPASVLERVYESGTPSGFVFDSITALTLTGKQICDYLWVNGAALDDATIVGIIDSGTYRPAFEGDTLFLADFTNGLNAGNIELSEELTGFAIYRYTEGSAALEYVGQTALEQTALMDCAAVSQQPVSYYMFGLGSDTFATQALVSQSITPVFWDWTILSCTQDSEGSYHPQGIYRFGKNLSSGSISNGNAPTILSNFTRYPTVQPAPANYKSGQLSSLIGTIDYTNENKYSDTIAERDAIFELSTTENTLFLKNRKGDLWRVQISAAIEAATMDNTREQAQTVSLAWTEIGSAEGASIILTADDELWPGNIPTTSTGSSDCMTVVTQIPDYKMTSLIYNSSDDQHYIWRGN